LAFEHTHGTLAIELAERLGAASALTVRYHGVPETGLWFSGLDAEGVPTQAFTHGQTEGSRGWFPCFDAPGERASSALTLDVPASWTTVGPGERSASTSAGARRIERWTLDFPHPSYLVSFVAGEFAVAEGQAGATPLLFLSAPEHEPHLAATFAPTADALQFLGEFAGTPYPYAKYAQSCVDNFPWGGMENISSTTLTPLILGDERLRRDGPPAGLVVHEAAHQWFGDLLTCADWSELWLNEGFATYLALLWVEREQGHEAFLAELRELQEANLREDSGPGRRPTVWNQWKEPDDVFDTRPYGGAAVRLNLLRGELGDEAFLAGVRAYVAEQRGGSVVTGDLRRALEHASGRDLAPFFTQWFLRAGYPELELTWHFDADARELVLELEQVQAADGSTSSVFTLASELELYGDQDLRRVPVLVDRRETRLRIACEQAPLTVRFDPEERIQKRLHQERTRAEWLVLARRGGVNARREASLALARLASAARAGGRSEPAEECAREVRARLTQDPSEWVRADAATGLGLLPEEATRAALIQAALADPAARVRVAALGALRAFGADAGLAALAEDVFAAAFSYSTQAAAAGLLATAAPARGFEFLREALELDSPHDVLAGRLLAVLAQLSDARVPGELARWAHERALAPTARAAAVDGLAHAAAGGFELTALLEPLLAEDSFHLRAAAVRALVASGDARARRVLADYHRVSRTAEERRAIEA
ncbi:MAG: M1 family metallopeptidase, partial [Planctomycetota bacterium]